MSAEDHFEAGTRTEYRSVLRDWDAQSAVRSKPRRMVTEQGVDKTFFSEGLAPVVTHPLVTGLGPQLKDELLVRKLGHYMDFTIGLEQEIVNPVLVGLARGRLANLPKVMRLDANRIYCDEAYHALSAFDLKLQVEHCTGISMAPFSEPSFARVLRDVKRELPAPMHGLVDLCATFVSETLISGTLSKLPADPAVVSAIRESVAEHAADERTHHAFFAKVFEMVWPELDQSVKQLLGPSLGTFIIAFLTPDLDAELRILRDARVKTGDAERIVAESYPATRVIEVVRHEARATLRLIDRLGVLEDPATLSRFRSLGLIERRS